MAAYAASLRGDLAGLIQSIDLATVRADQAWILGVMRRDGPALVRVLWRMLGREQDVLDAYQDCFCKLIAQSDRGEPAPSRSYVFRTAINTALDMRRRRRVRETHLPAVAAAAAHAEDDGIRTAGESGNLVDELRSAIESLPTRLRDVVVLRDLAEMSYREVAKVLGLTAGTARVYRREAIVALAERLKE